MNNARSRAKAEFDRIMAGEDSESHDRQGIERLEQLFAEAEQPGIDQEAAWKIVQDPKGLKAGVLALLEEVYKRQCRPTPTNVP